MKRDTQRPPQVQHPIQWGHLRGYAVSADPADPALKLLIAGFRSEKELEVFVLRLRGVGLLSLHDVEGRVNGEPPDSA